MQQSEKNLSYSNNNEFFIMDTTLYPNRYRITHKSCYDKNFACCASKCCSFQCISCKTSVPEYLILQVKLLNE